MIGSNGPRMLELTLPYVDAWNAWFAWFGNDPEKLRPMLAGVDETCQKVGRDPAEVQRTVAVLVRTSLAEKHVDEADRRGRKSTALVGTPQQIADGLNAFGEIGVNHLQLVVDPITAGSIEELAPALALVG